MSLQLSDVSTFPPLFFPVMNEYHDGGAREDYKTTEILCYTYVYYDITELDYVYG